MKEIKNKELITMLDYRKTYFSDTPAHHKHSIDGLTKLVTEQTGKKPEDGEAYVFAVKGNDHVKILLPETGMPATCEIVGERAREILRICRITAS